MEPHNVIEKVPQYTCTYSDDGKKETITLTVSLPGCEQADDIEVELEARLITVRVPGAYKLSVQLKSPVDPTDEVNKKPPSFDRNKGVLKLKLLALNTDDRGGASGPNTSSSFVAPSRPPIHESFFEDLPSQGKRNVKGKIGKSSVKRKKEEEGEGEDNEQFVPSSKEIPLQAPPTTFPAPIPDRSPEKEEEVEEEIKSEPPVASKEQEVFDLAKLQMNKESAAEVARRAELVLARVGKSEASRALKLMQKAAGLDPQGPYSSTLNEERWRAAVASSSSSSPSQHKGGPAPAAEGSESNNQSSETQQQPPQSHSQPQPQPQPQPQSQHQHQHQRKGRGSARKEDAAKPQPPKHAKQPEQKHASPPPPSPPPPPPPPSPPPPAADEFQEKRRWSESFIDIAERCFTSIEAFIATRVNESLAAYVRMALNVSFNVGLLLFGYIALIVPFILHFFAQFLPSKVRKVSYSILQKTCLSDSPLQCLAFFIPGAYITLHVLAIAYNILYWPIVLIYWTLAFLLRLLFIFPIVSVLWHPNLFISVLVAALPTVIFSLSGDSRLRDPIYDNLCFIPLTSYFSGTGVTCLLSIASFLLLSTIDSHHRLSKDWSLSSLSNELLSYLRFTRSSFKSFVFTILMCRVGNVRKMPAWTQWRAGSEIDPHVAFVGVFLVFGLWLMLVGATEAEEERERVQKEWEERRRRNRQQKEERQQSQSQSSNDTYDPGALRLSDESKAHPGAAGEVLRVLKCRSHYDVLGLTREEVEAAHRAGTLADVIKRAMRVKSLSVHPDKVGVDAVGAKEAFQRVNEAASILSDPQKRAAYEDEKSRHASSSSSSPYSQPPAVGEELTFACSVCKGVHLCSIISTKSEGRYCKEHDCFHALDNGVMWVDKRSIFSSRRYLFCYEGLILDVTDLMMCGRVPQNVAWYEANACRPMTMAPEKRHEVPNKFKGKGKKGKKG